MPRSVFERSAFVRQLGLAVGADDALEKRLSALVTSGEEDVSAAETARRLRERKNRIRHNKTGLLPDACRQLEQVSARLEQLRAFGLDVPVFTNQGPKGARIRQIMDEHGARRAVFIDDLAQHHASAAEHAPLIGRLHFCGEPAIAGHVPCALNAGHAHARIDNWAEAVPWLLDHLHRKEPA